MARVRAFNADETERLRRWVRALVERIGTQAGVAETLGVAQQTVSNALLGKPIGYPLAKAIAEQMDTTIEVLVTGELPTGGRPPRNKRGGIRTPLGSPEEISFFRDFGTHEDKEPRVRVPRAGRRTSLFDEEDDDGFVSVRPLQGAPGWIDAEQRAHIRYGEDYGGPIPRVAFQLAAGTVGPRTPRIITTEFVRLLAETWLQALRDDHRLEMVDAAITIAAGAVRLGASGDEINAILSRCTRGLKAIDDRKMTEAGVFGEWQIRRWVDDHVDLMAEAVKRKTGADLEAPKFTRIPGQSTDALPVPPTLPIAKRKKPWEAPGI